MRALLLLFVLCTTAGSIFCQEQCKVYNILPRDNERSRNNSVLPTNGHIPCDNLRKGWYRFDTGEIATSCVPPGHCGTSSSIWMSDAVPNSGITQLNEFCVSHSRESQDVCCLYSFMVNVTNCGGYLVYNFTGDDILCPSGYCRGDLLACRDITGSPTGFEPCPDLAPAMASPVLGAPIVDSNGQYFTQSCHVMYNGSDKDAAFRVTWSFDGLPYKEDTLTNGTHTTSLTSRDWIGHFGERLSCAVESFKFSTGLTQHSGKLKSHSYFGGLVVPTYDVRVHEGQLTNISIKSTLPVLCQNTAWKDCEVKLDLHVKGPYRNEILIKESCTNSLKASDWNDTSHELEKVIQVASLVDVVFKPREHSILELSIEDNPEAPYFDSNKTVSFKLTTIDEEPNLCYIVGSSQILGFSHNKYYAAGDFTGDCLMFKGLSLTGRELQVQTRLWRPNRLISATCGVAMQYGDVLIKMDMCAKDPHKTAPVITQGASDPPSVRVYLCDSDYEIVTADGVRLSVAVRELHLDIKLHVPPGYFISGEGACSFKDDHHWFEQREFHNYRLYANTSFFAEGALPFMKVESSRSEMPEPFCECGSSTPMCNLFQAVGDPGAPILLNSSGKIEARPLCHLIVPHDLNPDLIPYPLVFNQVFHPPSLPDAENFCRRKLIQYSSHECVKNFMGGQITALVNLCVEDFTMGHDGLDGIVSAAQGLQWFCQERLLGERKRYSVDSNGYLRPPSSLSTDMCYGMCSLHGTCMGHGLCACESGRAGVGCTVDSSKPPLIVDIKGGAICPMSSAHCDSPTLIVRNVAPSEDLQVQVSLLTLYPLKTHTFNLEAIFDNNFSVTVPMSKTIASMKDHTTLHLQLALSTDGKTFSNKINYLIYDDKCQLCTSEECLQKEDTCHIDGECYLEKELNPSNSSLICDPTQGLVRWTEASPSRGIGTPLMIG